MGLFSLFIFNTIIVRVEFMVTIFLIFSTCHLSFLSFYSFFTAFFCIKQTFSNVTNLISLIIFFTIFEVIFLVAALGHLIHLLIYPNLFQVYTNYRETVVLLLVYILHLDMPQTQKYTS